MCNIGIGIIAFEMLRNDSRCLSRTQESHREAMELRAQLQNFIKETAQREERSKTTEKERQEAYASLEDAGQHIVQLREQLDVREHFILWQ